MKTTRIASWAVVAFGASATASFLVRWLINDDDASPLWPPIGLGIGLALIAPTRLRPLVIVAILCGEYALEIGELEIGSIAFIAADVAAIGIGVPAVEWALSHRGQIERTAHALRFFASAIGVSMLAGAIASLGVESDALSFAATFAVGDALGILAITPIFVISRDTWVGDSDRFRRPELAANVATISCLTIAAFAVDWPLAYLLVPTTMWVAIRFGQTASTPLAATVVVYASLLTVAGYGPFHGTDGAADALTQAQFFSASILLSTHLAAAHSRRADNERRRLSAVLGATPDLVTVVDVDDGVVQSWRPAGDPGLAIERVLEHSETTEHGATEVVRVPGDDRRSDRYFEIRTGEVRAGRLVKVARDITHERRASLALTRAELRWRTMADAAFEGMVEVDLDGRVVFASDRFLEIRGLPASSIEGRHFSEFVSTEDWRRSDDLRDKIRAGEPVQSEMTVSFGTGDNRWVIVSSHPLLNESGQRRGSVIFFSETTELHRAEERRRAVEADLAVVERRERAEIARSIHDGPLQQLVAVDMKLGLAARLDNAPTTVTEAQLIVQDTIADLRSTLRDMTPEDIAAGQLMVEMESFARRLLDKSDTELIIGALPDEPPVGTTALTLFQIGREALVNAATHAEASTVTVSLERTRGDFVLRVEDDGIGVNPKATPMSADGHFGIRTMLERASDAGGTCWIGAGPDGGTVVEVTIPVAP